MVRGWVCPRGPTARVTDVQRHPFQGVPPDHGMRFLAPLLLLAALLPALERLDGGIRELAAGRCDVAFEVGTAGGTLHGGAPCELAGAVTYSVPDPGGVDAVVVAHSLRGVPSDDWRAGQVVAGRRHDQRIDVDRSAYGTPTERRDWGIRGSDGDWDDFSVQWDGFIRIPTDGVSLATTSDDGSRVWLDLDGDGAVGPGEWGSNGWGGGQGATQRVVHRELHAGIYRMRLQWEDGGGPDCCVLRWILPGQGMQVVPDEAFRRAGNLTVAGPVTLATAVSGRGGLRLEAGVRIAVAPRVDQLEIAGPVALVADLDLRGARVGFAAGGSLDLAGHVLDLGPVTGAGEIRLGGGKLTLREGAGVDGIALAGAGEVAVTGAVDVRSIGDGIVVSAGTLRSADRCVVRTALAAPLTTVIPLSVDRPGPQQLDVRLVVPAGAPADLGLGAWRADRQGRWFQCVLPQRYAPGTHRVRIDLGGMAAMAPEGHVGRWEPDAAVDADHVGLFLFATAPGSGEVVADARFLPVTAGSAGGSCRLDDLHLDGPATTGRRWSLSVRPDPYPADPYDPGVFSLDLQVTQPDGSTRTFAGFHDEPVVAVDRGDREEYRAAGDPCFRIRFRPVMPGVHHLRLTARWAGHPAQEIELPPLQARGAAWDGIARIDPDDHRFFSAGGRFVWPAGCNLNSTYDTRCAAVMGTRLTPDRGSFTRMAYLERLAAGGGTGCEVWLSPWNLGLEWCPDWPGFRGAGRYHPGHAEMLDRLLDRAEELGIRINLSLFNHGMARAGGGAEEDWEAHPYSRDQGGWLDAPAGLFSDDRAFAYQQRLFRYLAARYADSPAILGWKLWAEVNLAQAPHDAVVDWHARASAALAAADPWHHPITTHWCGDWHAADPAIAAIPDIDYLTIDAYKGDGHPIADLLCASTRDPHRPGEGAGRFGKAVLVTEFGGSAGGTSRERMRAEHAIGPWVGLVSGHAGSPMLWWFECVRVEQPRQ